MEVMEAVLIVFVRLPVEGKVKTRLAATIGHPLACRLYHEMATMTLSTAKDAMDLENSPIKRIVIYHSSEDDTRDIAAWAHSALATDGESDKTLDGFDFKPQIHDKSLGSKMLHAMRAEGAESTSVIIIGSDCPSITSQLLVEAASALEKADVVIGPAQDGGYYLLGLSAASLASGQVESLFVGIEWSSERVLTQTLDKISNQRGMRLAPLLTKLQDIDTVEDLDQKWLDRLNALQLQLIQS